MSFVGEDKHTRIYIPHLYGMVPTAGGDIAAIGRPRHRIYNIAVLIRQDQGLRLCVPHLHSMVPTAGGDIAAIGRPRHRIHKITMSPVGEECCSQRASHSGIDSMRREEQY